MKLSGRNIGLMILGVLLLVCMMYLNQPGTVWLETFSGRDEQPYGGKALHTLVENQKGDVEVRSLFNTVYELVQEEQITDEHLLIVSSGLNFDQADWKALRTYIEDGHTVLIASRSLGDSVETDLGLAVHRRPGFNRDSIFKGNFQEPEVAYRFDFGSYPSHPFKIPESAAFEYIEADSSAIYKVRARNEDGKAVFIEYPMGQGRLFFSPNPLLFTNVYSLDSAVNGFSAGLLSVFPEGENIAHIEYYQLGRMESQTPMRFILSQTPLRWAYFLTLITLLLFILFEAKRRQRIIPIREPLRNTSLEFTETLGQLYYTARQDHGNMIRKRVQYFYHYVARHYAVNLKKAGTKAVEELAKKTGKDPEKLNQLFTKIQRVKEADRMDDKFLLELEALLHWFYSGQAASNTNKR